MPTVRLDFEAAARTVAPAKLMLNEAEGRRKNKMSEGSVVVNLCRPRRDLVPLFVTYPGLTSGAIIWRPCGSGVGRNVRSAFGAVNGRPAGAQIN
jgi:uncharacterized protein YcfJ